MSNRLACLTLPGLSLTTILLNIPCLTNSSNDPPLILMDIRDYSRLRSSALVEEDNQKSQYLLMAYNELRRRGLIRVIDYSKFYSAETQYQYLRQNQTLIESSPDWVMRRAAVSEIDSWLGYARGSYQESFRESLGEDPDEFKGLRKGSKKHRRKLKRGVGGPVEWTKKVLNKDITSLSIRQQVDQTLDLDVKYVITSSGHEITGDLLDATETQPTTPFPNSLGLSSGDINTDASHLADLKPHHHIRGLDHDEASYTRDVLDTVGSIATDIAGTQYDDWVVFGPTLALPRYDDIFEFETIRSQLRNGIDLNRLTTETEHVITHLQNSTTDSIAPTKLQPEAEWIAEEYGLAFPGNGLLDVVEFATDLSDYSRELRDLTDRDVYSQLSIFLGASIVTDPVRRYKSDDIYRDSVDLMLQLDVPLLNKRQLEKYQKERRSDTWDESPDWYEQSDRDR